MNTNVISKRNSFNIPDDDLKAVQAAVQTLQARLMPHLVNIGADEKRALAKMGSKSVDFVSKTLTYATTNHAMNAALAYYQSVKTANKLNVPGAATINDDLATRFARQGPKAPVKAPAAA